jgi:putative oxidoreductase
MPSPTNRNSLQLALAATGMTSADARDERYDDMDRKSGVVLLAARLGLGAIFLISGIGKVAAWSGTVAYAGSKGVPAVLLAGATALEILGAISLLAGWKTRWGTAALIAFLVPVTLVFHDFWAYQGAQAQLQTIEFLKNVSIGGGLLAVLAAGPGVLSVDAWRSHVDTKRAMHARVAA